MLLTMGAIYMAVMIVFDVMGRSGITEGVPVLGWGDTPGPFTTAWGIRVLIKRLVTTVIFVGLMSLFMPRQPVEASKAGIEE